MKEINKKSDRGGQAKAETAANIVDKVLKKANEVRQRNDQHIEHLARFNLIDGVPVGYVEIFEYFIYVTPGLNEFFFFDRNAFYRCS